MTVRIPVRPIAWSLAGWLTGLVLLLGTQSVLLLSWNATQSAADTAATATVRNINGGEDIGTIGSVDMVWTDANSEKRTMEFDVATEQGWAAGRPITLRYDPRIDPDDDQFAIPTGADADRVKGPGPTTWLWIPALICLLAAAATTAGWWTRRARARAALSGAGEPVRLLPLLEQRYLAGQRPDYVAVALLPADAPEPNGTRLTPADLPAGTRVQRIAWTLDAAALPTDGILGQAFTSQGSTPRVVAVPAGKAPLLPLGRVRTIPPPGGRSRRYQHSYLHAAGAVQAPPRGLWVALPLGVLAGLLRGITSRPNGSSADLGTVLLVVLLTAVGTMALLLQDWGWRGGLPRTLPRL